MISLAITRSHYDKPAYILSLTSPLLQAAVMMCLIPALLFVLIPFDITTNDALLYGVIAIFVNSLIFNVNCFNPIHNSNYRFTATFLPNIQICDNVVPPLLATRQPD